MDSGSGGTSAGSFSASSSTFADGGQLPLRVTTPGAGGDNVSPALQWSGAPDGTSSYALECVDISANDWVHWLVVDLPAETSGVSEGASGGGLPPGARELETSFGRQGWGGPQPPRGSGAHQYRFAVYALDIPQVQVGDDASLEEFRHAIRGHVLAQAVLTGTFER